MPYYIRLIELYFEYKPSKKSVPCKLLFHTLFHYVFNRVNFPAHAYNYSHNIADCAHHVTRITTSWVRRGSLSRSLQRTLRCSSFSLEGISSVLGVLFLPFYRKGFVARDFIYYLNSMNDCLLLTCRACMVNCPSKNDLRVYRGESAAVGHF